MEKKAVPCLKEGLTLLVTATSDRYTRPDFPSLFKTFKDLIAPFKPENRLIFLDKQIVHVNASGLIIIDLEQDKTPCETIAMIMHQVTSSVKLKVADYECKVSCTIHDSYYKQMPISCSFTQLSSISQLVSIKLAVYEISFSKITIL